MKTVLRITSDRLRATALITDADYHILSEAPWPRNETPCGRRNCCKMLSGHTGVRRYFWEVRGERSSLCGSTGRRVHPGGG